MQCTLNLKLKTTPRKITEYQILNEYDRKVGNEPIFSKNEALFLTIIVNYPVPKIDIGKKGLNAHGKNKIIGREKPIHMDSCIATLPGIVIGTLEKVAYHSCSQIVSSAIIKKYALEESVEIILEVAR